MKAICNDHQRAIADTKALRLLDAMDRTATPAYWNALDALMGDLLAAIARYDARGD